MPKLLWVALPLLIALTLLALQAVLRRRWCRKSPRRPRR